MLTDFAEFTRYAFRGEHPYVTPADELHYVEKYLRPERARFGEDLEIRIEVAPEVLQVVVPVLSVQPLVENAVRHGVESSAAAAVKSRPSVATLAPTLSCECVMTGSECRPERAAHVLAGAGGGIGLSNVQARLQTSFGADYGLEIDSRRGEGTTVTMTLPKFRAGVRAA